MAEGYLDQAFTTVIEAREDLASIGPDPDLEQWITTTMDVIRKAHIDKHGLEAFEWPSDDTDDGDDLDDEDQGEDELPYSTNPRTHGGPPDGDPGDVILVVIADVVPPFVAVAEVQDDG